MSTVKVKFRKFYGVERLRPLFEGNIEPYLRVVGNSGQVSEDCFKPFGKHNQEQIELKEKGKGGAPTKTFILIEYPDKSKQGLVLEQFFYPKTIQEKIKLLGAKPILFFYIEYQKDNNKIQNFLSQIYFIRKDGSIWESFDMRALYSYKNDLVTLETFVYKEDESKIIEGKERLRGKFVGECV
jgi:hypothetical protein